MGIAGGGDKGGGEWTELPIVGCGAIGKMSQYFSPLTPTLCGPEEVVGGMIPCCGVSLYRRIQSKCIF